MMGSLPPLELEPQHSETDAEARAKPKPTGSPARDLLIELGTEELPVKALPGLAKAFVEGVVAGLDKRGFAHGAHRLLYTPRRLVAWVEGVTAEQPLQKTERRGPAAAAAFDAAGQPTRALQGFAASCGVAVEQLEKLETDKGAWMVFRAETPGARLGDLAIEIIDEAMRGMPIPKPMRWGAHEHAFARPVHWLLVLHGDQVLDGALMGLKADRMSHGHRFLHDKPIWISSPADYLERLRDAKVLVDPEERRGRIRAQVAQLVAASGRKVRIEPGILEEIVGLTEWPSAVLCSFESEFLRVPQEALMLTMESNQKFLPVLDAAGRLTEQFIGIANIESLDVDEVRRGYERVIRPRFADARFFFDEDLKQGIDGMNEGLASVSYQQKLGSYADKVERIVELAEHLAAGFGVEPAAAAHMARWCRADLQSRMVGEFPELQGIMGRYYAAAAGTPPEQAVALDEMYQPRFAGDAIAPSALGRLLAVCERLDTLVGGFAAGMRPSGNKDPFALRRAALGLARTLIEGDVDFDLLAALRQACTGLPADLDVDPIEVMDFIYERLRSYFEEQRVPPAQLDAVLAVRPDSLVDLRRRLAAIAAFVQLPDAGALAAANKRIRNILRKSDAAPASSVDAGLLQEEAEKHLGQAVDAAVVETDAALARRDYVAVLRRLADLRAAVDSFFDAVMVNAEDPALRANRLALLQRLADRFLAVADVSALSVG